MLATVAIVVLIFAIVSLFALRFSRANSMERSIRSYKRRLGTIAEVVEQTAQAQSGQLHVTPIENAQKRADEGAIEPSIAHFGEPQVAEPADRVYVSKEGRLVFGDTSITPVVPPKPPIYEDRALRRMSQGHRAPTRLPKHDRRLTRPLVAAVVVLIAAGGVVGGIYAAKPHPSNSAVVTPSTTPPHHPKAAVHHTKPPSHQVSNVTSARLLSSSATSAVFSAPSGTYTVAVYVDGLCWFGFQHVASQSGPWLAMATLGGAVNPTSYRISVRGSLAITVGAPSEMTKVLVNGNVLGLPTRRGHSAYSITLLRANQSAN